MAPGAPAGPAFPCAPFKPFLAPAAKSFSLSVRPFTSLVLTVPFLMSAPVTITAAYDVPPSAMTSAAVDARWRTWSAWLHGIPLVVVLSDPVTLGRRRKPGVTPLAPAGHGGAVSLAPMSASGRCQAHR